MQNTENVKITKAMVLTAVAEYFEGNDFVAENGVTAADICEYANKTIDQLAAKASKAKAKAAEKKAEGDALRETVESVLTDELQTIDQVTAAVNEVVDDEVTRAKVQARLSQLVKVKIARKEQVTTEDKRKIMAYALVGEATEDAE